MVINKKIVSGANGLGGEWSLNQMPLKEIKSLGAFNVLVNLHPEVQTEIVIKTVSQEELK